MPFVLEADAPTRQVRRAAVERVLGVAAKPLDAYRVARLTGLSAMEAGRTLQELHEAGKVVATEDGGSNPLATCWRAV